MSTAARRARAYFAPRTHRELEQATAWVRDLPELGDPAGAGAEAHGLTLPEPRPHPGAVRLWAEATGDRLDALEAVLAEEAWIDDDGQVYLWPWYPEEDADERLSAAIRAESLGVGLPPRHLDAPFDPSHYFARSGPDAVRRRVAARGVDPDAGSVRRIVVLPRAQRRFEGGGRAPDPVSQASGRLARWTRLAEFAGPEAARWLSDRIDADLRRLAASLVGDPWPVAPPDAVRLATPSPDARPAGGRLCGLAVVDGGAVVVLEHGGWLHLDNDGAVVGRWPGRVVFAARGGVLVELDGELAVRDLAACGWRSGWLADAVDALGIDRVPTPVDVDDRSTPEISACGRYALDADEGATVVRLSDQLVVDEALSGFWGVTTRKKPLFDPERVSDGVVTELGGVRFTVSRGNGRVAPGRGWALALGADDRWWWSMGEILATRGKAVARVGVPVLHAAFAADASAWWALTASHLVTVALPSARARALPLPAVSP